MTVQVFNLAASFVVLLLQFWNLYNVRRCARRQTEIEIELAHLRAMMIAEPVPGLMFRGFTRAADGSGPPASLNERLARAGLGRPADSEPAP